MKPPEVGDRVRFRHGNDVIEGTAKQERPGGVLLVVTDGGKHWYVGSGNVLVVEP